MIFAFAWAGAQLWAGGMEADNIRAMGRVKEKLAEMNAGFAEQDAFNAEASGHSQSARYQVAIEKVAGAQRSGYAANNVDVNFGTAKEIQSETRLTGLMNQFDIQRQGHERALGFEREARNIRSGAQMGRIQTQSDAANAQAEGVLNAGNTLMSGYSNYSKGGFMSKNSLSKAYRAGNLAADSRARSVWTSDSMSSDEFWGRNPYK